MGATTAVLAKELQTGKTYLYSEYVFIPVRRNVCPLNDGRGPMESPYPRWLVGHPRNGAILGLSVVFHISPQIRFLSLYILVSVFPIDT